MIVFNKEPPHSSFNFLAGVERLSSHPQFHVTKKNVYGEFWLSQVPSVGMGVSWLQTTTEMCDLGDLSRPWPARMDSISPPGRTSRLAVCPLSVTFAAGTDPVCSFRFGSVLCNHWPLLKIIFFDVYMAAAWLHAGVLGQMTSSRRDLLSSGW